MSAYGDNLRHGLNLGPGAQERSVWAEGTDVPAHPGSPFERDDAYNAERSARAAAAITTTPVISTRTHFEPISEQAVRDSAGEGVIPFGDQLTEGGLDG